MGIEFEVNNPGATFEITIERGEGEDPIVRTVSI